MGKVFKNISVILILTFCLLFLTSCTALIGFEYQGDYPELYTIALSTIPGLRGYQSGGFFMLRPPYINVREIDDFGRVLFSYSEGAGAFSVIMQRTDDNYAYFYPHYNHIAVPRVGTGYSAVQEQRNLYSEMIENLKIANNWNQPMSDDSEFDMVRIVRRRMRGPVPDDTLRETFYELSIFAGREPIPSWDGSRMRFLREDRYGRTIYTHWWSEQFWVAIIQPDHSFDIDISFGELIGDDYQTDLRLLMEANGWNIPP